ncbi:MAG: hypothetical protein ACXABO_16670 [Promethearchaeota archaeon]|jgi:hypothetical protein
MLETYNDFMVFGLKDTGEKHRLNITEEAFRQNNGNNLLQHSQVAIIVKEELRRIYIWKGISSSVRKKFIASRVASELQRKLTNSSNFHRCKIISVDQGDEPTEFLDAFGFQKHPIPISSEDIQDLNLGKIENISSNRSYQIEVLGPKDNDLKKTGNNIKNFSTYNKLKNRQHSKKLLDKILSYKIPNSLQRRNILIGKNILYGITIKKAKVFNEKIEEKEWGPISYSSHETIELEGDKLRIHFNKELGEVEAIEILEKVQKLKMKTIEKDDQDFKKWTVKQLKQFCHDNKIKVPSSYRKAQIVNLVLSFNKKY